MEIDSLHLLVSLFHSAQCCLKLSLEYTEINIEIGKNLLKKCISSNSDGRSTFAISGTIALAMLMATATVVPTTTTTYTTSTAATTTTGAMGVASMGFTRIGTNIAILVAVADVVAAARVAGAFLLHIVIGAFPRGFPAKRKKAISAKDLLE